mmetsp:Transcript_16042/g.19284  ORF Transcript_16042/g.19284 Transcript_16042/m.19284 type:complete len:181 (-) Transcript_16042:200-742(-)
MSRGSQITDVRSMLCVQVSTEEDKDADPFYAFVAFKASNTVTLKTLNNNEQSSPDLAGEEIESSTGGSAGEEEAEKESEDGEVEDEDEGGDGVMTGGSERSVLGGVLGDGIYDDVLRKRMIEVTWHDWYADVVEEALALGIPRDAIPELNVEGEVLTEERVREAIALVRNIIASRLSSDL